MPDLLGDIAGAIVAPVINGVTAVLSNIAGGIISTVSSIFSTISNAVNTVAATVQNAIGGFVAAVTGAIQNAIATIQNAIGGIVGTISGIVNNIVNTVTSAIGSLGQMLSNTFNTAIASLTNILNGVGNTLNNAISNITAFFSSLPATLTGFFQTVNSTITTAFDGFGSTLGEAFGSLGGILSGIGTAIFNAFNTAFSGFMQNNVIPVLTGFFADVAKLAGMILAVPVGRSPVELEWAADYVETRGKSAYNDIQQKLLGQNLVEAVSLGQCELGWQTVNKTYEMIGAYDIVKDYYTAKYTVGIKPLYYRWILRNYQPNVPGVGDLVRFVVREAFDPAFQTPAPAVFVDKMLDLGFSPFWATAYWTAHWKWIPPETAIEMFHKGIISFEDLQRSFIIDDWHPKTIAWWTKHIYRLPTRIEARVAVRLGLLTDEQINEILKAEGVREDYIPVLRAMMQEWHLGSLYTKIENEALSAYEDGLIGDAEFLDLLANAKMPKNVREASLQLAKLRRQWEFKKYAINTIYTAYKKDVLTRQEAIERWIDLSLDTERISLLLAKADIDKYKVSTKAAAAAPKITVPQLVAAVKNNLIDIDDFISALEAKGYSTYEATLIANIYFKT
jgi:hypothetical protein